MDNYMQSTVLLVTAWPIILGCDVAGVVVEVGKFASSSFKVGGEICGCTRLGVPGHSTFQDYVCPTSTPCPTTLQSNSY